TTALIQGFNPGTSPPPVKMPMRMKSPLYARSEFCQQSSTGTDLRQSSRELLLVGRGYSTQNRTRCYNILVRPILCERQHLPAGPSKHPLSVAGTQPLRCWRYAAERFIPTR